MKRNHYDPSKQERLFEKKYAKELIRIAEGDYKSARILAAAELKDIRIENAFYLCQQAIIPSPLILFFSNGQNFDTSHKFLLSKGKS